MRNLSVRFKLLASITACTAVLGAGVFAYMTLGGRPTRRRDAAARRLGG